MRSEERPRVARECAEEIVTEDSWKRDRAGQERVEEESEEQRPLTTRDEPKKKSLSHPKFLPKILHRIMYFVSSLRHF